MRAALMAAQTFGDVSAPSTTAPTRSGLVLSQIPSATASSSWGTTPSSQPAARVGLDLGGVITKHGQPDELAPGALEGVAALVSRLGPDNVCIIGQIDSVGQDQDHKNRLLRMDFFTRTGMHPWQVFWATSYVGPASKGSWPGQSELIRGRQTEDHDC
jgi:hypothetical protein